MVFRVYVTSVTILDGVENQHYTSSNIGVIADHVSFFSRAFIFGMVKPSYEDMMLVLLLVDFNEVCWGI